MRNNKLEIFAFLTVTMLLLTMCYYTYSMYSRVSLLEDDVRYYSDFIDNIENVNNETEDTMKRISYNSENAHITYDINQNIDKENMAVLHLKVSFDQVDKENDIVYVIYSIGDNNFKEKLDYKYLKGYEKYIDFNIGEIITPTIVLVSKYGDIKSEIKEDIYVNNPLKKLEDEEVVDEV